MEGDYMDNFTEHAEKLVREFRQRKALALSKRQRLIGDISGNESDKPIKYKQGLEVISSALISALNTYQTVFNSLVPEIGCTVQIKKEYPDNLDITFFMGHYALRFITRKPKPGEQLQDILVDGFLYCESSYKGGARTLEAQAGLWSEIGSDAWGMKDENEEFIYFLKDILPNLIASKWYSATFFLVHSNELHA